jgi:cytochrome b561
MHSAVAGTPYNRLTKQLHWLSAAVILWALGSGTMVALVDLNTAVTEQIVAFNILLTSLYIPVFLLRVLLRYRRGSVHSVPARLVHLGLYGATAVVLFSGVLMLEQPLGIAGPSTSIRTLATSTHRVSCLVLAVLVCGHIAAVAWHHCRGRNILGRML